MNKLVLFDVDKTLIGSAKGHLEAFSKAFRKVYSVETGIEVINYHGMTDQQIIIEDVAIGKIGEWGSVTHVFEL